MVIHPILLFNYFTFLFIFFVTSPFVSYIPPHFQNVFKNIHFLLLFNLLFFSISISIILYFWYPNGRRSQKSI
jgi:hypothetical protein